MSKNKSKFNNAIRNKNSYVGRTYKVNDNDLPHDNKDPNKTVNLLIIEENGKHLGGVRTSTQRTRNTRAIIPRHRVYKRYKTFLEIEFYDGTDITANDKRLQENPWKNNLSEQNVEEIREELYHHSRQAVTNRANRDKLKSNRHKKSRH